MALINCPECSKEVSNTCRNCIHCGYSLQISSTIETPFNAENPKGFREVIKKRKIIFIFALSALALAVAIILIFSFSSTRHPFDGLYIGQTRESVQNTLGKPNRVKNKESGEQYSWNVDDYYNFNFLNNSGTLSIWYDDNNLVTHAWFEYSYPFNYDDPSAPPTSEERDNARTYILAIIDFYTGKYGVPEDGYYDYEWRLIDGSKIGLNFDLEPETSEDVITIYWG